MPGIFKPASTKIARNIPYVTTQVISGRQRSISDKQVLSSIHESEFISFD